MSRPHGEQHGYCTCSFSTVHVLIQDQWSSDRNPRDLVQTFCGKQGRRGQAGGRDACAHRMEDSMMCTL